MNIMAKLDGSDEQDLHASTVDQRCSAFKDHLANAVLILESLDSSLLDHFNQDQACKDLVNRLLSVFPTLPLSRFARQIDQVVKSGLEGIVANIARVSQLDESSQGTDRHVRQTVQPPGVSSTSATTTAIIPSSSSRSPANDTVRSRPAATKRVPRSSSSFAAVGTAVEEVKEDLKREVTIHFLKGGYKGTLSEVLSRIGQALSRAENCRYTVLQSNRVNVDGCLPLTSSPATDSFPSMIKGLSLSALWTVGATTRIREGGTVECGFKILDATSNALFDLDPHLKQNQTKIHREYLHSRFKGMGRDDIRVSEEVEGGIYMLSGSVARLERLVADGEKSMSMVISRTNRDGMCRTDLYQSVIRPFCLRY